MAEFYDFYNNQGDPEVYEGDETKDYSAVESFSVEDDYADDTAALPALEQGLEEHLEEEPMVVEEEEATVVYDTVPGTLDKKYEEFNADDNVEPEPMDPGTQPKDAKEFINWLDYKLTQVPRHSGETIPGCERATAYVKDLDNASSKAMRSDYDGKIDELELDKRRKDMQRMVDRLENHTERLRKSAQVQKVRFASEEFCSECDSTAPVWYDAMSKTSSCVNCDSKSDHTSLQKTAGTPVLNVYMTPFERAIVGTVINATVSGGKNIEEVYDRLKNKYNFTPREELSFKQLIADYGYPLYFDRGLVNEPTDPASGNNVEWPTNYNA